MSRRIRVSVVALDPVSRAGVAGVLRFRPELDVLAEPHTAANTADVTVVVVDEVDDQALQQIKAARRAGMRTVVLIRDVDGPGVLETVRAGANAIVRRADATDERLSDAIRTVKAGDGSLPPDLLGRLLTQVGVSRDGEAPMTYGGLTHRELRVLRLLADGYSTAEIASELAYSERTIKNAIHDLTTRLQLRNRSHAVAFAVRAGLI